MKNKIFISLGLLLLLAITSGIVIYNIYLKKASLPTKNIKQSQANNKSANDLSTWITYKNTELGFEIKHPADWAVKNSTISSIKGIELELTSEPGHSIAVTYHESLRDIKPNYSSIEDYLKDPAFEDGKLITISGNNAFSGILNHKGIDAKENFIVIQHLNHIYVINYIVDPKYAEIKNKISETLTFN